MPNTTVYKLTAKAQRELVSATKALPPNLHTLLGHIDGTATVDAVKSKLGRVDERKLHDVLERLEKAGYIEPAGTESDPSESPITLDFTIHARAPASKSASTPASAPSSKPAPASKPASTPTSAPSSKPTSTPKPPPQPKPDEKIDFSADAPAPQPTAEQIAEAQDKTLAGMRTLKEAGYYVSILSKPGIRQPPRSETKYSVLLIDNDAATAILVARTLMLAEFDVRSAESREQALAQLKKVPLPDAIVLSPQVPKLNGLDLLAQLQVHKYYASVPVVVITTEHTHETVVDALARGAAGYMTKPFKPEALLDTVRAVLGLT